MSDYAQLYKEHGCKNRAEYLKQLADEHNQPLSFVKSLSNLLGQDEDFDGLINALEDAEYYDMFKA